jgi:PGF-CTERM protein
MSADAEDIEDPEQTSIYHEVDDGWEELPTDVDERTEEEITFSGTTEDFSLFAVAEVQSGTEDEETTNETDSTEEPDDGEESDSFIPGFGVPVAIAAMVALALLARRKQQ